METRVHILGNSVGRGRRAERSAPFAATHLDRKHVRILVTQHRVLSNERAAAQPARSAVVTADSAARRGVAAPAAPATAAAGLRFADLRKKLATLDLQELHRREQIFNHLMRRRARFGEKTARGSGGKRATAAAHARCSRSVPAGAALHHAVVAPRVALGVAVDLDRFVERAAVEALRYGTLDAAPLSRACLGAPAALARASMLLHEPGHASLANPVH